MIEYFKRKIIRWRTKRTFQEYPHRIEKFRLEKDGDVDFAVWLNPLEQQKSITQNGVDFYRKFVQPGDLAIDIGTHMGDTTVPMALAVGKEGLILGFDPNPHVFKIFQVNASLNKAKTNIVALPYAITADDGDFHFYSREASFNNGGVAKDLKGNEGYTLKQTVTGINLEKYLNENYQDKRKELSFIKVDTEGYDKDILKSISGILTSLKPTVLAECFRKLTKEERSELYHVLSDSGYQLYRFDDFTTAAKFTPIQESDMNNWKHFDILAVHRDRAAEIKL
ncbi:MAG: FkbM family methyltransferase [Chryseolinea sp.]